MKKHSPTHPVNPAVSSEEDKAIRDGLMRLAEQDQASLPPLPTSQRVWDRHQTVLALAARARDLWITGSACLVMLFVTAVLAWRVFPGSFPSAGALLIPLLTIVFCAAIASMGFLENKAQART